jgi:PAS domain S-box-containing protein
MTNSQTRILELEEELALLRQKASALELLQVEKDQLVLDRENSQHRFRTIFEEAAVGMKIISSDLKIIKVNNSLVKLLGYTEQELIGSRITDIAHPDFVEHWKRLQHELWNEAKTSFSIDTCITKKNKKPVWCHVNSIRFLDGQDALGYTIIEDISERKELERVKKEAFEKQLVVEKLQTERQQQRLVLETTINTQEEERRRIAEGLHNSVGQLLYGIKMALDQVKLDQTEGQQENLRALKKANEILTECIVESRRISHNLMPTLLADFGLGEAVLDVCEKLSGTVRFKCVISRIPAKIDKHLEIVIYRVVQELMLNVVKHARATTATVTLTGSESKILINVQDNGAGFNPNPNDKGIGLKTIKSSIFLFNGTVDISSAEGKRTLVSITIPI